MGTKKSRIINDKTSVIRKPSQSWLKSKTAMQPDVNDMVSTADEYEYIGHDPVTDTPMVWLPDGTTHNITQSVSGDYSVIELHTFLQNTIESNQWDTSHATNMNTLFSEDQKMGYTAAPPPRKSKKTEAEFQGLAELALHEEKYIASGITVMRVPGGLIYTTKEGYGNTRSISTTFVPWN